MIFNNSPISKIEDFQMYLAEELADYTYAHKNQATFGVILVSTIDFVADVIKMPISCIANLAYAILNIFGAAFSDHCSLKDAADSFTLSLFSLVATPFFAISKAITLLQNMPEYMVDPVCFRSMRKNFL